MRLLLAGVVLSVVIPVPVARGGVATVRANLPADAGQAVPATATVRPASQSLRSSRSTARSVARAPATERTARRYNTIGHRILDAEGPIGSVTPGMYGLLDRLIDESRASIGTDPVPTDPAAREAQALKALKAVDDLMVSHSFVYPGCEKGLVQLLSDGLTPTRMDQAGIDALLCQPHNARRRERIAQHRDEPFFVVDCDTASAVYLAIGDALGLPLAMVEVPEHNFVRWYFPDGTYLNWETMDGRRETDDHYRQGWGIPKPLEDAGVFLSRMSEQDVAGYWSFVVGLAWERQRRCGEAIDAYELATRDYGRSPSGWNNLAWILVTCQDAAPRDGNTAVKDATKAVSIYRNANNLDTLACAYAEAGNFAMAIETESEAYQLSGNPEYARTIEGFRRGLTWIQQHPAGPSPSDLLALQANR